jgi:hypothetical protein
MAAEAGTTMERESDGKVIGWITMLGYLALCGLLYGMN